MSYKSNITSIIKQILILAAIVAFVLTLIALMGDAHDYPCGVHLPNGYFRACR